MTSIEVLTDNTFALYQIGRNPCGERFEPVSGRMVTAVRAARM